MNCVGKNRVKNNIFTYELDMLLELRTEQTGMEDIMKKSVVVNMQNDMEARPIALLVQKANQFSSRIYMESADNKRVNVKSIMGMMNMALLNDEEVVIDAEGEDEQEAIAAIEEFLTK